MNIKINDFSPLPHSRVCKIVAEYIKQNETGTMTKYGWLGEREVFTIKETGKYPIKIELGSSRYHVKCRKTKKSYVFDVWLAV